MADRRPRFRELTLNRRCLFVAQLVESIGNFGLVTAFTLWATTSGGTPSRITQLVSWVILANTIPRIVLSPLVARVCSRVVEPRVLIASNLARGLVCILGLALGNRGAGVVATLAVATTLGALDLFFPPARAAAAQRNLHEDQRAYFGALILRLSGRLQRDQQSLERQFWHWFLVLHRRHLVLRAHGLSFVAAAKEGQTRHPGRCFVQVDSSSPTRAISARSWPITLLSSGRAAETARSLKMGWMLEPVLPSWARTRVDREHECPAARSRTATPGR